MLKFLLAAVADKGSLQTYPLKPIISAFPKLKQMRVFQKFLAERCRPTAEEEPENPDMVSIILFSINLGFGLTWRVSNY